MLYKEKYSSFNKKNTVTLKEQQKTHSLFVYKKIYVEKLIEVRKGLWRNYEIAVQKIMQILLL